MVRSQRPSPQMSVTIEDDVLSLRTARDKAVQAAREAVRDSTRLTRLLTILNDAGPIDDLLDRGLSTLSELFLADIAILLDPVGCGTFSPLASIGLPEIQTKSPFCASTHGLSRRIMASKVPIQFENVQTDDTIDDELRELGVETIVAIPVDDEDAPRGVLILCRCAAAAFTSNEIGLLRTMAHSIGRTLVDTQRNNQMAMLVESGRQLSRHLDSNNIAIDAVTVLPKIVNSDAAALILTPPSGNIDCVAQKGLDRLKMPPFCNLIERLLIHTRLSHGEPFIHSDLNTAMHWFGEDTTSPLLRAVIALPLHRENKLHGVLLAIRFLPLRFSAAAKQTALLLCDQVAAALENATLYQTVNNELIERKRLEAAERKWERQQQQIQKAKSLNSMAGAVAHHFNNQLCVVIGSLEIALNEIPKKSDTTYALEDARDAAKKAAEVSQSMLVYIGQSVGVKKPMDLSAVCKQHIPLLQAATRTGLDFNVHLPLKGPTISANSNQIRQVLTQLITNSWEAVEPEKGVIQLSIKQYSPDALPHTNRFPVDWTPQACPYACLEIKDSGVGIEKEDIDRLFDPFFSRKFTGRGLGLAVVLGIVKAHGGAINVESTEGKGSVFQIFLPVSKKAIPKADTALKPTNIFSNFGALVVDDEPAVRSVATLMLKRFGLKVFTAYDGIDAIRVFKENASKIQIAFCDLSMPRKNGWETAVELHQLSPSLSIVVMSGYDELQVKNERPIQLDAPVFLHKPFDKKELGCSLEKALSHLARDSIHQSDESIK